MKNMDYLLCPFQPPPKADNGGCAILTPGWTHPKRKLDSCVIILGRKGSVFIEEEGTSLEIKPNRITVLFAKRTHLGKLPINSQASYYWLHFTLPSSPVILSEDEVSVIFSNKNIIKQRLHQAALLPQQIDLENQDYILNLFRELLNEQETPSFTSHKFQLLFQSLIIAVTEATINLYLTKKNISKKTSIVHSIIAMVASELSDPNLSIKSIAKDLYHNTDYVGRQFKNIMEISVREYILQQRIKFTKQLLEETQETVTIIAEKCGFTSMRHFLRQFKRVTGMTPSELRSKHQAIHINIL